MRSVLLALPVAFLLVACADDEPVETDSGVDGAEVFAETCAACHGADGSGTASGEDLNTVAPGLTVEEIESVVSQGIGTMPPQSSLDEDEVRAVAQHTFDTWGDGS